MNKDAKSFVLQSFVAKNVQTIYLIMATLKIILNSELVLFEMLCHICRLEITEIFYYQYTF